MTIEQKVSALESHGVWTSIRGDKVFALDEYTIQGVYDCEFIDVTRFGASEVASFLGY